MTVPANALLGEPAPPGHRWVTDLSVESFPSLADHRLQGMIVLPGSAYLQMALSAVTAITGRTPATVHTMAFERAFIIPPSGVRGLQVELRSLADIPEADQWEFVATGAATGVRHASARILAGPRELADLSEPAGSLAGRLRPGEPGWWQGTELLGTELYRRLHAVGNDFGPAFRGVQRCVRSDGQAAGIMQIPAGGDPELAGYLLHPAVLDTAMQVLAAAAGVTDRSVALVGVDRLRLLGSPGAAGEVYARLRPHQPAADQPAADQRVGDVLLVDAAGRPAVEFTGVRLRYLPMPRQVAGGAGSPALTIAVAATFTAEPLTDALSFWFDTLGMPVTVAYASVNQPFQQLLDPASLLSTNTSGANVILVRPDDLCRRGEAGLESPAPSALAELFADRPRFAVPGIGEIAHLIGYETESLYEEIFVRQAYLRHGIDLRDGDCVFDVGANIGLFTLFVHSRCADARVFAFEPSPPAYDVLRRNVAAYCPNTTVFDCGLADSNGERPFTFYRNSTVFSGFAADPARDRVAVEAVVRNAVRTTLPADSPDLEPLVDELTRGRLDTESYLRPTRTLSSVIESSMNGYGLPRIDLLKIDAEGSEAAILAGIADEHWPLIRQVVAEVHDAACGRQLQALLTQRGFQVVLDSTDEALRGTGFAHVFARRPERIEPPASRRTLLAQAERNAEDLIQAIAGARRSTGVPYLVVVCPASTAGLDQVAHRLADGMAGLPGVVVLTADAIQRAYPVAEHADVPAEQLGGIPYTSRFFAAIGTMIARTYLACRQPPVIVLALDCDQTLWAGVCGEDGLAGVQVDAPRRALQEFAVRQHDAGTLLCLCSKNNPADVLEVFARRTDMPLGLEHIVARRLNWREKSANLAALAEELGQSLDGFVFLDDDPVECAEVRSRCPEVLTLRLPAAEEIPHFLHHIWAFDRVRVTEEDRARTDRYRQEGQRRAARDRAMTLESFFAGLDLRVTLGPGTRADLPRVAQLTQRTNQFTATAIRRTEAELAGLLDSGALACQTVRVEDRFGDYGLVGAMLFRLGAGVLRVDTFVLSCRALGRGVEHRMLAGLGEIACAAGLDRIEVPLVRTGRNEPAREFFNAVTERSPAAGAGAGLLGTVPAETAARLIFDPAGRAVPAVPASAATAAAAPRNRLPTSIYRRIAEDLRDLDAIVEAIESSRVRRRPQLPNTFAGPDDEIERSLVSLWQRVLGLDRVGVDDNFFELGGTSLRAVQVMAELSDRTGAAVHTVSLFEKPTIRAVAAMLRTATGSPDPTGATGQRRGRQRREMQRARRRPAPRVGGPDGA